MFMLTFHLLAHIFFNYILYDFGVAFIAANVHNDRHLDKIDVGFLSAFSFFLIIFKCSIYCSLLASLCLPLCSNYLA